MAFTEQEIFKNLDSFGLHRIEIVTELTHQGPPDGIGPALLLAIGTRETGLRNIAGDGGHGRGWVQIDDRFHAAWLDAHAGCSSGSWKATFKSALPQGRVPTLTAGAMRAVELLRGSAQFARAHGVPKEQVVRFAVAAYNAGAGGALEGLKKGNVDARTAGSAGSKGGDYSKDVLKRQAAVAKFLKSKGLPS
jgi:uncharacterized protein YfiM (DUF2279 family)